MARALQATCLTVVLLAALAALCLAAPRCLADEVDPTTLTPEAVWAAMPTMADMSGAVLQPQNWSPNLPEFNVGPLDPTPAPGERFYLVQRFTSGPVRPSPAYLQLTVTVFTNAAGAHQALRAEEHAARGLVGCDPGLHVGNESGYFVYPGSSLLVFRGGPFVGRVEGSPPLSVEQLALCGRALEAKLMDLRYGRITAPALPADFDQLMPPPRVELEIGPTLVSAVLPPQAWGLTGSGSPQRADAQLEAGGVTQVYHRRYLVSLLPGQVLDATLWPFKDADAASAWVQGFRDRLALNGAPTLRPGQVGPQAAFTYSRDGQYYELQFAKGQYVADVIGSAPTQAGVDPLTQVSVRRLAERWYMALPAPLVLSNTP